MSEKQVLLLSSDMGADLMHGPCGPWAVVTHMVVFWARLCARQLMYMCAVTGCTVFPPVLQNVTGFRMGL